MIVSQRGNTRERRLDLLVVNPVVAKAIGWIAAAIPMPLQTWLAGPVNVVRVDRNGSRLEGELHRIRRTKVIVSPEFVLTRHFTIPREGRRDLRHAVELLVRSETPFAPAEVFGRLVPMAAAASPGRNYRLDLIPWWPIHEALSTLRIGMRGVADIRVGEEGGELTRAGPARGPLREGLAMAIAAVPAVLIFGAIWAATAAEVAVRHSAASEIEASIQEELSILRSASTELDARHQSQQKFQIIGDATSRAVPIADFILDLSEALPETAEISRLELYQDVIRLHLKTADALDLTRALDRALPAWSATVEGTIITDPAGGEHATISFSWTRQ